MTAATLEQGAPIETVSYAVFGIALDGTVQSWSSGAERLYGIRSDEIVGKPHTLLEKSGISVDLSSLRNEHGEVIAVAAVAARTNVSERRDEISAARIAGLQAVTAALSRALTPAAVAEVFVREGAAAAGASGGFVDDAELRREFLAEVRSRNPWS